MTRPAPLRAAAPGFSLPELLVVVVLASLLVLALLQGLLGQRRFFEAQRSESQRGETVRLAAAVLGSALREADLSVGDAEILAPGRVRFRMPLGLALVCGTDNNGSRVGAVPLEGAWSAVPGDSVRLLRAAGISAHQVVRIDAPSNQVACVASGVGMILRLDVRTPDAVPAAPSRAFRSQVLEVGPLGGEHWLFRVDGLTRERILGPLDGANGFRAWYEDAAGSPVGSLAGAERIAVRLVARAPALPGVANTRRDTLTMRFGGRNR